MNNPHNVEKAMQKFQQLAKDAQSNGDPVLAQNYLQHADHYLRRFNELNERKTIISEKSKGLEETNSVSATYEALRAIDRLTFRMEKSQSVVLESLDKWVPGALELCVLSVRHSSESSLKT